MNQDEQYLKMLIKAILREQSEMNVRSSKGYGATHPFIDRKSTNLGISAIEKESQESKADISDENQTKKNRVNISRAFERS